MQDEEAITELVNLCDYEEIYLIDGPGKMYVGRHAMTNKHGRMRLKEDRLQEHFDSAKKDSGVGGCRVLSAAIREHGEQAFTLSHLEFCKNENAKAREIFWINHLDTVHPFGYNLTSGTEDGRYVMHQESKERSAAALTSFGKLGRHCAQAKVMLIRAPNQVGYRGYHKGEPHGFFSNNFSMDEKRDMALTWHLYGELKFERRLPRRRQHTDKTGQEITQTGVKVRFNTAGEKVYHAYHPTRPDVKEKCFKELEAATNYTKLLQSFDDVPSEYLARKNPPRPSDVDLRYIKIKKANGRTSVQKGTEIGHEVNIPANLSNTGKRAGKCFSSQSGDMAITAMKAIQWRNEHLKQPLPSIVE